MIMCVALIRGHGQVGTAVVGVIALSMINVSRYAVIQSPFGSVHIKVVAAKPIALVEITAPTPPVEGSCE
ncbi:hypothetical protein CQ12_10595 [Bradyrhizobium jicamae]|uniref:Uncharacterized protein n=1 Tax=Bradyrhizobium jicamae TaxID=280332 RepID=A0A0R3LS91_9BRAD|nr:hypothetical protein CQ12_10595 [Bradyrhizobium jicamae]